MLKFRTFVGRTIEYSDEPPGSNVIVRSQVSMLRGYSEIIRGNLSKVQRLKIVALVTVEVHARDVIDKLAKAGCKDINAFDWLSQLRLYWEKVQRKNTYRQIY